MDIAIVFVVLLGLILLGVPLGFSMAIGTLVAYYFVGSWHFIAILTQRMYEGSQSTVLLAIPFFILVGNLMNEGGMTIRVLNVAKVFVGRFRGGMAHVNIISSMLFSGMSGSAVADASGLGIIEMKMMRESKYDEAFSAAVTASSSTIGPIIPPSIPFVIFGAITGTSVGKLFLGGIIPGLAMGIGMMAASYIISIKRNYPVTREKYDIKDYFFAICNSMIPIGNIVIIIGGIVSGLFTPTEASAVAVLYAFIMGFFVLKELKLKMIPNVLKKTFIMSCNIIFIIAAANAYVYALTLMQIPERFSVFLGSLADNRLLFLLVLNAIFLVLGCFMEGISLTVLLVPIIQPIAIDENYNRVTALFNYPIYRTDADNLYSRYSPFFA